tara:strand:+ start:101 stop:490 length:390 start_codon:yes stop_codon:yes gene_type:complete
MSEIGQVVWFDRKKGFGFVKVVDPKSELCGKELFIHFTSIQCENSFKVLYPGETISLDVKKNTEQGDGQKEYITSNVSGVFNSKLMIDNEKYIFKVIRKSSRTNDAEGDVEGDAEGDVEGDAEGDADDQ